MNKIAHLFLIALAIAIMTMLAAIAWSQPQRGKIKVTVLTKANEPLQGATIRLLGTKQGAIAKFGGIGQIDAVMPGTYSVAVTYVGLATDTIKNIRVSFDSTSTFTVHLKERPSFGPITIQPKLPVLYPQKIDNLVRLIPSFVRDTSYHGFSVRGGRATDSIINFRDPVGDQFSGPISRFAISEISVKPVDTTSRVYRAYYKK